MKTIRNSCNAFSWDVDGHCRGVCLDSVAGKIKVAAVWQSQSDTKAAALAETFAVGRRELGMNEASYCLVAPESGGWGMADLDMPLLKGPEMEAALAFELRKCTPLPLEQLSWGYRVLDAVLTKDKQQKVRLFYAKKDTWRKWMTVVTGLTQADIVIPAPVALDPVFAGKTVYFPGKNCYKYAPSEEGRDAVPASIYDESGKLRPFEELFPLAELDIGELASLSEEERIAFIPALMLAVYGMTRSANGDAKTLPKLPVELRPKRYQGYQILSSILAAIIVIFLAFGLMQAMQVRMVRLRLIKKDINAIQAEIRNLQQTTNGNVTAVAKQLEEEMARYKIESPSLSDVLIELTRLSKAPAWCAGSFTWTMDIGDNVVPVTFMLREAVGDTANVDICTLLNNSPILGDVVETKSAMNRTGFAERRFSLKARYDTAEEKAALEEYNKRKEAEENKKKLAEAVQQSLDNAVQKKLEEVVGGEPENEDEVQPQVPATENTNKGNAPGAAENKLPDIGTLLMTAPADVAVPVEE